MHDRLESILVVYQNPAPGRQAAYDDWYTNIHIRDAMRLDGAIATQRFCVAEEQPVLLGKPVEPAHWAHTIYEWQSAFASVEGHAERAGTPRMEISRDCSFEGLRDYFYRPEYLSHGWDREAGFRRGDDVLTALIEPEANHASFVDWFKNRHAAHTLALPGFGSAGLFSLHEAQSLPEPADFPMVAVYGLTDRSTALGAWAKRSDARSDLDLAPHARKLEIGAWQPRIARLRAEEVLKPSPEAATRESEARKSHAGNYLSKAELDQMLMSD
jgi:hypothetical protein